MDTILRSEMHKGRFRAYHSCNTLQINEDKTVRETPKKTTINIDLKEKYFAGLLRFSWQYTNCKDRTL